MPPARLAAQFFALAYIFAAAAASPLHSAAERGDVAAIERRLAKGDDIDGVDSDVYTPLHLACLLYTSPSPRDRG